MTSVPVPAGPDDAAEVLVLQRCCWVTEAIANEMWDLPPLRESLSEVERWMPYAWVLRDRGRLVAAARASRSGEVWRIGRLMVAPDRRGDGLGRVMLRHAESAAPQGCTTLELFTGVRSAENLRWYHRAGYVETRREAGVVFLRKSRTVAGTRG